MNNKIVLFLFLIMSPVDFLFASCKLVTTPLNYPTSAAEVNVALPAVITVTGNETPGTVLWSTTTTESWTRHIYCDVGDNLNYTEGWDSYVQPSSLPDVIESGVPGIGVKVSYVFNGVSKIVKYPHETLKSTVVSAGSLENLGGGGVPVGAGWFGAPNKISIVALGTGVVSPGTISFPSYSFKANSLFVRKTVYGTSSIGTVAVVVKNPGCTTSGSSNDYNVTLDDINSNRLPSVGSTYGDKEVKIGLSCKKDTKIKMSLSATAVSGLDSNGVTASSGSANGVGVQVLRNSSPFALNAASASDIQTIGPTDIDINIPLTVRYYRTGSVTSGNVSSVITYTISYE